MCYFSLDGDFTRPQLLLLLFLYGGIVFTVTAIAQVAVGEELAK